MKCLEIAAKSLVLAMALCAGTSLCAATVQLVCSERVDDRNEVCVVELTGPITPGDAERLENAVRQATRRAPASRFVRWLVLGSPGGDVLEAMRLADVVRNRLLWTSNLNVVRHAYGSQEENEQFGHLCASSCFLVLVAGANRILISNPGANARIGLHRPYLSKETFEGLPVGEAARRQQTVEEVVRTFSRRERIPDALIDEMMQRSSTQIYWLTRKDLIGLSGYATWFEEMKTALCGWDKGSEQAAFDRIDQSAEEQAPKLRAALAASLGDVQRCVDEATRKAQRSTLKPTDRARKSGG
jgi:hypothetical protein